MKIFTSDLHHRHKRIIELSNRYKETTAEQHDEWLVELWNSQVTKNDVVYHLGDFSFASSYPKIAEFTSRLNGTKILIKGNHDRSENFDKLVSDGLIAKWRHYEEVKFEDTKVCLFHFPIASWNQQHRGSIHLHGHSHGNFDKSEGRMLDVGLDSAYNLTGKHEFFKEAQLIEYFKHCYPVINDTHRREY